MPCDSSHMAATPREIRDGALFLILDELSGVEVTPEQWRSVGYDKRAYNERVDTDALCRTVCSRFQTLTPEQVAKLSLEAQMWWRDHQAADADRLRREHEARITQAEKDAAIAKLTPYERKLLGL